MEFRDLKSFIKKLVDQFEEQSHPLMLLLDYGTMGLLTQLITRKILAYSLEVSQNQAIEDTKFGLFRM